MSGVNWKQCTLALLPLMLSSWVYAERAGFYTIVGPDGRIMVIDRNAATASKAANTDTTPDKAVSAPQPAPVETPMPKVAAQPATYPFPIVPLPSASAKAETNASVAVVPEKVPAVAGAIKPARPVAGKGNAQKVESVASPSVAGAPTATVLNRQQPVAVSATKVAEDKKQQAGSEQTSSAANTSPVTVINGEQYIQSEYLEQKEFNLEGKKRFYSLPDDLGGTQVLQREKGVDMNVFKGPQVVLPKAVTLSKNYQRINASQVTELTGVQCFTKDQLEKAKLLKTKASLDFWPRPSFEPKFDFVIAEFESAISDIELTSYAATSRNPVFYWPLPVFLDKNACVLEGVNAFYLRSMAANSIQHQAIQGFLHVPQGAKYLLLTPLESAADLSDLKLTNKGQVRLTPIR